MHAPLLPWERPDEHTTVSARLAATAAQRIVDGGYAQGTILTEAELAGASGASRTPAREAMVQLESWGLVRLIRKKGAIVTTVTAADRHDLIELRVMFELAAVRTLEGRPQELTALGVLLDDVLARQHDAVARGDLLDFASADYACHALIILAGTNRAIAEVVAELAPRLARLTRLAVTDAPARVPQLLAEHTELARLARTGDTDAFAALLRAHVEAGHPDGSGTA